MATVLTVLRVVLGFILCALLPVCLVVALQGPVPTPRTALESKLAWMDAARALFFGVVGALIAVPLYAFVRNRLDLTVRRCAGGGALLGGLLALAQVTLAPGEMLEPRNLAQLLGVFAGFGVLCGMLFWVVALAGRKVH